MQIRVVDTTSLSVFVSTGFNVSVVKEGIFVFTKETPSGELCLKATISETVQEPVAIAYCDAPPILVVCCTQCSFLVDCSLIHEYWLQNTKVDRIIQLPYIIINEKYKSATFHPNDSSLVLFLGGCYYDTYRIGKKSTAMRLSRTIVDTNEQSSDSLSVLLIPNDKSSNSLFVLTTDFSVYRLYPYFRPGLVLSEEQWNKQFKYIPSEASPLFLQQWRKENLGLNMKTRYVLDPKGSRRQLSKECLKGSVKSHEPVRWVKLLHSEKDCSYYVFYNSSHVQIVVSDKMDWIVLEEIQVANPFQIFYLPNEMSIRIATQNKELTIDFSYASINSKQMNPEIMMDTVYDQLSKQQQILQDLVLKEAAKDPLMLPG